MLVALRRRLCSSVSSIELIKVYTASRSIGSSSCTEVAANVAQDCSSSESKIENGPSASPPVRNILRRRRLGIRRSRSTRDTDAIELALDSVVKIFTVASSPNYFLPWQNKSQRETMGSGFVIAGNKILTNAHVVADHTFVLVRKHGSPTKHKAQVEAVGHECDLAILSVESDKFWEGMNPLELGDIPLLQEAVAVVGYPQGGDNISVTKGVVSRVEPTQYVHGATQLMAIQIDAAINPGNSGGPAIMGSKVAGVAFQNLSGAENIGYIIPVPVIKHFIAGVEERGKYVGFCSLGLSCQPTENVQLRNHFRMNPEMTGVLVSKINPLSDAHKVLKKDDIVLVFDGVPVANDGTASAKPNWPKLLSVPHPRNHGTSTRPSSLLIETVEGQVAADSEQAPSSVARRLILLRHAKSSWEDPSLKDHDRPLSGKGQADAVEISHKLQQLGWVPQLILSSNALRTRETLRIMQQQVKGFLEAEVHYFSSFYSIAAMDGQTAEHLQRIICNYSRDDILTVMCMGHNRGWEEAASMLTGASIELKTCNAALLEATGKSWDEAFALAGHGGWKLQGIVKPS